MTTESPPVAVTGCVRGRVQGVSFRYSMRQQATDLGVVGWVQNLPEGSVAFHAEGTQDAVDALLNWCQGGPAFARVDEVRAEHCDVCHFDSFEIIL